MKNMTVTLLVFSFMIGTASAEVNRPSSLSIGGRLLTLRGQGLLKVGYVFKVYEAAFYLDESFATKSVFSDAPKRLELLYLRDIKASDIIEIGNETLMRQETKETLDRLQERIDRLNRCYVDVKAGDSYTLTYIPGIGSELALNNRPLALIEGADFAAAYFGIWLDARTHYPEFRKELLGL